MIQYALKCSNDHRFDSWFQSAEAFDKLQSRGLVSCSHCGSTEVTKAIMAPRVQSGRKVEAAKKEAAARAAKASADQAQAPATQAGPAAPQPGAAPAPSLSTPANEQERALAELKKQVEANSEYVGDSFVDEARAMHVGDAPERAIHGEAKLDEAKQLIDDGVPVVPLPFRPGRKAN